MLGASDVGKSLLTSQFMSSNDVTTYNNEEQLGKSITQLPLIYIPDKNISFA